MYQKEKNRNEIWEFVKAAFFSTLQLWDFYLALLGICVEGHYLALSSMISQKTNASHKYT